MYVHSTVTHMDIFIQNMTLSLQLLSWLQRVIDILTHCLIPSPTTLTHSKETLSDATSYKQVVGKPSPWDWFPDKVIKTKSHLCSLKGHQAERDNCRATDDLVLWPSKCGKKSPSNELLSCIKSPEPKKEKSSHAHPKYSARPLCGKQFNTPFWRWRGSNDIICGMCTGRAGAHTCGAIIYVYLCLDNVSHWAGTHM